MPADYEAVPIGQQDVTVHNEPVVAAAQAVVAVVLDGAARAAVAAARVEGLRRNPTAEQLDIDWEQVDRTIDQVYPNMVAGCHQDLRGEDFENCIQYSWEVSFS